MTPKLVYRVCAVGSAPHSYLKETTDRDEALRFAKELAERGTRTEVVQRDEGPEPPTIWQNVS